MPGARNPTILVGKGEIDALQLETQVGWRTSTALPTFWYSAHRSGDGELVMGLSAGAVEQHVAAQPANQPSTLPLSPSASSSILSLNCHIRPSFVQ